MPSKSSHSAPKDLGHPVSQSHDKKVHRSKAQPLPDATPATTLPVVVSRLRDRELLAQMKSTSQEPKPSTALPQPFMDLLTQSLSTSALLVQVDRTPRRLGRAERYTT